MTSAAAPGWWQRARAQFTIGRGGGRLLARDELDRFAGQVQAGTVLLIAFLIGFVLNLFADGDTGWHLGAGRWIVAHRAVPTVDPFSHTFAGTPWTAHEWLAEIVMVGAHHLGGWAGLSILFILAGVATFWMVGREAFRLLPARWAFLGLALVAGLLLPFSLARPHMLAWPLLTGWTLTLLRARQRNAAPPLAAALLMVVWANLHASYIFALALAGFFAFESLIANPRNRGLLGRWALFVAASVLMSLVTPFGPEHFIYPFQVSNLRSLAIIHEWRRSTPFSDPAFYACVTGMALFVALRWRRLPLLRVLLLASLAGLAVMHIRHQMLFAIVGGLVFLSMMAAENADSEAQPTPRWLVPGLLLVAAARLVIPYHFLETETYPLTLISRVPAEVRSQPVLNEYGQGGPLVMLGIRPYIDGRADMYGDDFTFRARAISRGDMGAFREDVAKYRIRWVLMRTRNALTKKLDKEPGWRRLGDDGKAVVFVATR